MSRPKTAAKHRKKRNNQQKTSGLDGREMVWDESTMEGAGGARFDRFGGNRDGWEGET